MSPNRAEDASSVTRGSVAKILAACCELGCEICLARAALWPQDAANAKFFPSALRLDEGISSDGSVASGSSLRPDESRRCCGRRLDDGRPADLHANGCR